MKRSVFFAAYLFLFLFLFFLFAGTGRCHAGGIGKILRVPQEYSTIQRAIDAAQNLDTVLVSEGRYLENIKFKGKGIVVTSKYFLTKDWQTTLNTVIDGSTCADKDSASTVSFVQNEDSTAVLDGFTITGGTGTKWVFGSNVGREGGGVLLCYSSAIVKNNIVMNNRTASAAGVIGGGGGGISSMYGNPTITNNVIASNIAGYAGGVVLNWSMGRIRNNIISHNTTTGLYGGGGVMIWQAPQNSGVVENNTIVGNVSAADGGGITMSVTDGTTIPVVRNNIVWGNRQATGRQVTGAQYITCNDVEDFSTGTNISAFPQLQEGSFLLAATSPCVDAGDPASSCRDVEDAGHIGSALPPSRGTVRNDIGAYGGLLAKGFPSLDVGDLRLSSSALGIQCSTGQQSVTSVELLNLGSKSLTIDSIRHTNPLVFSLKTDFAGRTLGLLGSDSIRLGFGSPTRGKYYDTLRVFHHLNTVTNPIQITVTGIANCAPYLNKSIPGQNATVGRLFTFQIPDSTFLDRDNGDTLTYQATGLPSWLSFNSKTKTFQGAPTQPSGDFPFYITVTVNDLFQASTYANFSLFVQQLSNADDSHLLPTECRLWQNYPNPFNPTTAISYRLSAISQVSLRVFDILGREVAVLVDGFRPSGVHTIRWDASSLPSGVYMYSLRVADVQADSRQYFVETRRMTLTK